MCTKCIHKGLLILRVGIGAMMMLHGYPKMFGGTEMWTQLGSSMQFLGINFGHTFWGFMASFAEFGGGFLLIIGLFTLPALILMIITMLVAAVMHISTTEDTGIKAFMSAGNAIELFIVCVSLFIMGPGIYSLDNKLRRYILFNKMCKYDEECEVKK